MNQQALDSLGAGVFIADVQHAGQPLKYVNEALGSLLGRAQAELEGLPAVELLAGNEEGAVERAAYLAALSSGQETVLELPLGARGGKSLWVEARLSPMKVAGRVTHVMGVCVDVTTRRTVLQEEARLLQVRTRALQDLSEGVWIGDASGRMSYVNAGFIALTGYVPAEAQGQSWTMLQASGSDAAAVKRISAAIAAGRACHEEVLCHAKGGHVFWAQLHISPILSADGAPLPPGAATQHVAIFADISARKSCSTTAQLCDQALASTSEAILITDPRLPDNPIIYANAAFERMTGYSRQETLGRNCRFLQGPDSDPVAVAELAEAGAELRPVVVEVINYRKSGEPFWNQVSLTPMLDADGAVVNFVAVQQDVSERRAAEEVLQLRDAALGSLTEGITITDPSLPDQPLVYCNDAFLRITGYTRQEVVGRNCRFLQGPDTDRATLDRVRTAVLEGRELTVELLNYRKNGEKFWNLLSLTPVRDATGRLTSVIGVQSDITDLMRRRQAERELQEARAAAETASEAKSLFLANMSHEIRTPLNGVMVGAQLLLGTALNPEQRELVDTMLDSSTTLLTILGDILDFSKIDRHSMVLERAPLCLRQTLEAAIELVAGDATAKQLELAYLLDPALSQRPVMGDGIRIRQVLVNLLANAIKFTEKGEVTVEVSLEQASSQSKPRVHFAVRDTGIGIPPELVGKLFKCFRQGHESLSRKYGGTGLGLALSRRLAELMGGTVWVESREGEGSTFHFTIALDWGEEGAAAPADEAAEQEAAAALEEATGTGDPQWAAVELHRQQQQQQQHGAGGLSWPSSLSLATVSAAPGTPSEASDTVAGALLRGGAGPSSWAVRRFGDSSTTCPSVSGTASVSGGGGGTSGGTSGGGPNTNRSSMDAPSRSSRDSLRSSSSMETPRPGLGSAPGPALEPLPAAAAAAAAGEPPAQPAGALEVPTRPVLSRRSFAFAPQPSSTSASAGSSPANYTLSSLYNNAASQGPNPSSSQPAEGQPSDAAPAASPAPAAAAQEEQEQAAPSSSDIASCGCGPQLATACVQPWARVAEGELTLLRGRSVVVAVAHRPTAMQVLQSCQLLGMEASLMDPAELDACAAAPSGGGSGGGRDGGGEGCPSVAASQAVAASQSVGGSTAAAAPAAASSEEGGQGGQGSPVADFCVTTCSCALAAVRGEWRGRPVVAVGSRDEMPLSIHPLVSVIPKPVRHGRLVAALIKSAVFMGAKIKAEHLPLLTPELDAAAHLLSLLPERQRLHALAMEHSRVSLDNSLLQRPYAQALAARQQPMSPPSVLHSSSSFQLSAQQAQQAQQAVAAAARSNRTGNATSSMQGLSQGGGEGAQGMQPEGARLVGGGRLDSTDSGGSGASGSLAFQDSSEEGGGSLPPPRILVAEDNLINQRVIKRVLQRVLPSARSDMVCNGVEVLDALAAADYDLVLMDIHMPVMDGLEASRQIQARIPPERRPVVVALSADTLEALHERCREAGMREFICKPFRVEDVKRVLQLVQEQRGARVGAA